MRTTHCLQRAVACACIALATASAVGCGELLGISEPFPRGGTGNAGEAAIAGAGDPGGTAGEASEAGAAGETVSPGDPCAVPGATQCDGLVPQVCTGEHWITSERENGGAACPALCIEGKCAACRNDEVRCQGNDVLRCDDGVWAQEQKCASFCRSGECVNPPSCAEIDELACRDTSCCRADEVPGGSFVRDYDGSQYLSKSYTATLSPFLLDRFEVTVARFTAFVDVYDKLDLQPGDGKSPNLAEDRGWQWNAQLPKDRAALVASLECAGGTWLETPNVGKHWNSPINCVSFYVAYAFCIWDGGRLPTEAEWNFAAAGGSEQREYPWSTPSNAVLDLDHAFYDQESGLPGLVGTRPLGDGRWLHADLAGNVAEWTLDFFAAQYPTTACKDCLNATEQPTRSARGGAFRFNQAAQKVAARRSFEPGTAQGTLGIRCARDLPSVPQNEMVNQ